MWTISKWVNKNMINFSKIESSLIKKLTIISDYVSLCWVIKIRQGSIWVNMRALDVYLKRFRVMSRFQWRHSQQATDYARYSHKYNTTIRKSSDCHSTYPVSIPQQSSLKQNTNWYNKYQCHQYKAALMPHGLSVTSLVLCSLHLRSYLKWRMWISRHKEARILIRIIKIDIMTMMTR